MASVLKHLRSSTPDKRPTSSGLADGQIAINTASGTPGMFFKDSNGGVVKVGPVHVGPTAPNAIPAGSAGNSLGELWVNNGTTTPGLNYFNGSSFVNLTPSGTVTTPGLVELATAAETQAGTDGIRVVTPSGLQSKISDSTSTTSSTTIASATAVKAAYDLADAALPRGGGRVTGNLEIGPTGSLSFEGSSDDSFETTLTVVNPTADRTITFPDVTGTVITTGDTGTVTSAMIADGAIVDADINASAAIALSKLATGALPSGITVNSSNIVDGSIVNADVSASAAIAYSKLALSSGIVNTDISASAAIALSKLATGALPTAITVASVNIVDGTIVDADVNASAAIAGTKISPNFGGQNVVTTGTSTAASLIPTGSSVPTNGVYLPSANTVGVATNGGERLRITSAGLVGVGISAPSCALQATGSATVSSQANVTAQIGPNVISDVLIGSLNGNTPFVASQGAYPLQFRTNNAAALTIDSSGRVGIGTTSPAVLLDVVGQVRTTDSTVDLRLLPLAGSNVGIVGTVSNHALSLFTNNSERARIDSSGRLLVGISSARSNFYNSTNTTQLQVEGGGEAAFVRNSNDIFGASIVLGKSRSSGNTIVQADDVIGILSFQGNDGSEFVNAASISVNVDGTPSANDMPSRLIFSTTADGASVPTERMRIDSAGAVIIGTNAVADNEKFFINQISGFARDSDGETIRFYRSAVKVGNISLTATSTAYNTSSDYRLKENILPVTDGITRLQQLKPSRFNFIADPTKTLDGFLAHEAAEVVPECVTGEKDAVDADGKPIYQGIDQSKMVPLVVAALQECIKKVEALEVEVASLKAKVAVLESA